MKKVIGIGETVWDVFPSGKAEKEREDLGYYDNSGSNQKQDV